MLTECLPPELPEEGTIVQSPDPIHIMERNKISTQFYERELVTHNTRDFQRVQDLKIEDWGKNYKLKTEEIIYYYHEIEL